MLKSSSIRTAVFALVPVLCVTSVAANVLAISEIHHAPLQLVDLDLSDSAVPTYTIENVTMYGVARVVSTADADGYDAKRSRLTHDLLPVFLPAAPFDIPASSTLSFSGGVDGTLRAETRMGAIGYHESSIRLSYDMMVGARTGVLFDGTMKTTVFSDVSLPDQYNGAWGSLLFFSPLLPLGNAGYVAGINFFGEVNFASQDAAPFYFENPLDYPIQLTVVATVGTAGYNAAVSAVPEGSTSGMLLAGLSAVLWRTYRSRRA